MRLSTVHWFFVPGFLGCDSRFSLIFNFILVDLWDGFFFSLSSSLAISQPYRVVSVISDDRS
jgi:hypothetical protein